MQFRSWRLREQLSLDSAAQLLGLDGINRARTVQRLELGERGAEADFVAAVERMTKGQVTAQDWHDTRLEWLRANGKARDFAEPAPADSP